MKSVLHLLAHDDVRFEAFEGALVVRNPATSEALAYVRKCTVKEVKDAILRAEKAQKRWAKRSALERADRLWAWYDAILEHQEALARLMTLEQGKVLFEARAEVAYAASFVRFFAEEARRIQGDVIAPVREGQRLLVLKQAIGVTAAITPWNFPAAMITRKAAPALAVGCAMLIKPASQTPLTAYALAHLAYQSGLEEDLLPVLCGNAAEISTEFCENEVVRKISFTGSTEIGAKLLATSAPLVKKVSLELGGNAPFIVFEDADLDRAVDGLMLSKFRNSGQTCVCTNRVYVARAVYALFAEKLCARVKALRLGNGLDEGVEQGPLIDGRAVEKIEAHIQDACALGARVLVGGKRSALGGTFFEPTVLADVSSNMALAREETFAPLCPLFVFDSEEEVVQAANDTIYGLAAYFYTQNAARQWRVAEALEYGMVGVNTGLISNEVAPFGGVKASGLGREGSRYGVDEYLEMKYVCLDFAE